MNSPGANVVPGHVTGESEPEPVKNRSTTTTSVSVTFPVFVTRNEYVTLSSTTSSTLSADLTSAIEGAGSEGTSTVEGGESTGGPLGGVPVVVAVFDIKPESTSAC